ncbi:hypothetical protein [Neokomagataea thailandica]|uniref:Lipoprotein n=1 Tax=Neokomagataea tanensis NBRC 106556 TaxID=1223519 RepID=A0ABQ0QID4_9PROT|nr:MULTISPECIES: hypothetical protein [Neokomagataea]GBR45799.1 hypothetical protein AA106556_0895 [Neokomagataea tanensis NBRC 106556]
MKSRFFYLTIFVLFTTAGLGGCQLIDQRSFDSQAGKPPVPYEPPAPAVQKPPAPFLSIPDGTAEAEYGPVVEHAAHIALQHKNNVLFIVQALAPPQPTLAAQQALLTRLTQGTLGTVAQHIAKAGAQPLQIELHTLTDPTIQTPVIRVELR